MLPAFEFATAQQIVFGAGKAATLPSLVSHWGRRALIVHGRTQPRVQELLETWRGHGWVAATFAVTREPTVDDILAGVVTARAAACDFIVAIGGGSVIDSGKAIAALLTNPGDPLDYLEVVGRGQPLQQQAVALAALPTTAGTGAEVTRNAVLAVPDQRVKVSLRSPSMLPRLALVDPELTYSMPPGLTAATGLDALTQCIEPYISVQANPLTDGLAAVGIQAAARSLRRAYVDGGDTDARADMALASLCGGLALANARLGAVHGFAGVLGGMHPIPHGTVCARLLPAVIESNVTALRRRAANSPLLARFDQVAALLTGRADATAADGVAWVQELCAALAVPPLAAFGVTPADFPTIVAKSKAASSMKGNPIVLTDDELTAILAASL